MPAPGQGARYRITGRCSQCGGHKDRAGHSCSACLEYARGTYELRKGAKLCTRCGKRGAGNGLRCGQCKALGREQYLARCTVAKARVRA